MCSESTHNSAVGSEIVDKRLLVVGGGGGGGIMSIWNLNALNL